MMLILKTNATAPRSCAQRLFAFALALGVAFALAFALAFGQEGIPIAVVVFIKELLLNELIR